MLTCADLVAEGFWNTATCCVSCHEEPPEYLCEAELPDGRVVACCCQAAKYVLALRPEDGMTGFIREAEAALGNGAIPESERERLDRGLSLIKQGNALVRTAWQGR